ncbi:uncharacterized protein LOC135169472 [Diachasmimorpha longicaudata]|uniref:uncharacterized protein LOC135169472 n=1 Tax=Diachasmimorpha longicaudata TaxID=58733 RepID=UPI0030B8EB91
MEDAKSEKSVTMEEQAPQDSSSWGEWTIIHDDRQKNTDNTVLDPPEAKPTATGEDDEQEECHVVEEAREVIEEIDPASLESSDVPASPREEHSDGISVITDSDEIRREALKIVRPVEQTIPRFGLHANFIAACCLAVAIGFGIGCVVGTGKTQLPSPSIQVPPRPSFPRLEESHVDVPGDVSISIESEPYNPTLSAPNIPDPESKRHDLLQDLGNAKDHNLQAGKFEQIPKFKNSLQKLKLSLDTLCSLINKNQRTNYENICTKNSKIFEVIELKDTVEYIVNEFGYREDVSMKKFIEGMDSKIETMVTSFLDRFSKIVEKMRGKLYQRICLIRNTYDKEAKIQEILDQRSISLENCNHSSPKAPNPEKKRRMSKREERGVDDGIPEEMSELESWEIGEESTEAHESKKNKGKKQEAQEAPQKRQHGSSKEGSSDNSKNKNNFQKFKPREESNENSNEQKNFKEFKFNYRESNDDFRKLKPHYRESSGYSKEQKDFHSSEERNNPSKLKKKYSTQWGGSNENSSEENVPSEQQKENKNGNRNDFKPLKKYGTSKGEPKENFVEKKHGNNYESLNEHENRATGQNEKVCYSKKCSKPYDTDEKYSRKGNGKNGQWQFERAQGRRKYRSDEDDGHGVWYDDRAKGRERARHGF